MISPPSFTFLVTDPSIAANTLLLYVGGRSIGGSTLGLGGSGGYSYSGTAGWATTIETRGEPGAGTTPQTDFGPWGGSIAFDDDVSTTWYFDPDPSTTGDIPSGEADFYSVAIHELAHVLGYSSGDANNSWASKIVLGNFTGTASVLEHGGPVPLHDDSSHWAEGTTSFIPGTATGQEAVMDPSILLGSRKFFTDLDFAGLQDIGWEISAVPEPAEIAVITGLGLLGFAVWRKRRTLQP